MRARLRLISALLLFSFLVASGCSTPRPVQSGRRGYLDRKGGTRTVNLDSRGFQWPLQNVQVTSPFGKRGKEFHEGVDLRAPSGTPVYAAQSGVVLYAGTQIRGYGKLVVVRHSQEVATIYAHNSKLMVIRGQRVRRGQQIAVSGATGHVSGPHLHFEIRRGLAALNPLTFLPLIEQKQVGDGSLEKKKTLTLSKR